jgi:hypothetical protein
VKEEKEGEEEPPAGQPYAAKTGAARGRSRTHRERLLPLLPLPPRRRAAALVFFIAGKPRSLTSPPRSTSARGHRGEDTCFSPLVDTTAIEPRRNARRFAPPRLLTPKFGKESDLWVQLGEKSVRWKEGFFRCVRQKNPWSAICFRSAKELLS